MIHWLSTPFFKLLGFSLLLLLPITQAQAVLLTLSQPKLVAGGQLEVLVEAPSSQAAEPTLEIPPSWKTHFELLEKMHQVETMPRGDYLHRWSLLLQHQQADSISRQLELAPLRVNGQISQPLRVLVKAARKKPARTTQRASQPLTMQQKIDFIDAYVGQTLVYELLIRYQGFPLEPRLSPLEINGATARQLGEGREQGFNQRGVSWQEARWQELVQLHETEVTIMPRNFSTRLSLTGQADGQFYKTQTPELKVKVRPIPETWPKEQPWLPALGVNLEAAFLPNPRLVKQDQALELSIHLDVVGQQARNLPQFKALTSENWRIEPLTEELSDRLVDGFLVGSLKQRLVFYPKQAGNLKLPDLTLHWWDVREHKAVKTQVKLGQLQVLSSGNQMVEDKRSATKELSEVTIIETQQINNGWLGWIGWLMLVLVSAAVLVFSAWLLKSQPKKTSIPPLNL